MDRRATFGVVLWVLATGVGMGYEFGTGLLASVFVTVATMALMLVVIASAFGVVRWMVHSEVLAPN